MSSFPNTVDKSFIAEFDSFSRQYVKQHLVSNLKKSSKLAEPSNLKKSSKLAEPSNLKKSSKPSLPVKNLTPTSAESLLLESMLYTLLSKTKRFRPLLIIYTAKALNLEYKNVLAWALSVEMLHSFSLIHDDLPCMDDDDMRRGKLSNHKIFGEALALLSGNSLLVEAFSVLVRHFNSPKLCVKLVTEAVNATGARAMMLGQVGDLILDNKIKQNLNSEKKPFMTRKVCNELKTGALINSAVLGVVYIYQEELSPEVLLVEKLKKQLSNFSFYLGRAFQWADDLVDGQGREKLIKQKLKEDSDKALMYLEGLPGETKYLEHLIVANQTHFK